MTNDVLLRKARTILVELRLRRPTLLQQWMAHYVAEMIDQLEGAPDDVAAAALADRCAATIVRLWELQVQVQTNAVNRGVNRFMVRTALTDDTAAQLRAVLEAPEAHAGPLTADDGVTVWQLSDVEQLVIEVLWGARVATRRKTRSVDQRLATRDEAEEEAGVRAATSAQKELLAVFPALAQAPLVRGREHCSS